MQPFLRTRRTSFEFCERHKTTEGIQEAEGSFDLSTKLHHGCSGQKYQYDDTRRRKFDSPQFWKAEFFTLGLARPAGAGHEGGPRNEAGAGAGLRQVPGPDTRAAGYDAGRGYREKFQALLATIKLLAPGGRVNL